MPPRFVGGCQGTRSPARFWLHPEPERERLQAGAPSVQKAGRDFVPEYGNGPRCWNRIGEHPRDTATMVTASARAARGRRNGADDDARLARAQPFSISSTARRRGPDQAPATHPLRPRRRGLVACVLPHAHATAPARRAGGEPAPDDARRRAGHRAAPAARRPSVTGSPTGRSASVNTVARRTHGPRRGETKIAVLPIQPSPACVAAVLWAKTPAFVQSKSPTSDLPWAGRARLRRHGRGAATPRPARQSRGRRSRAGTRRSRQPSDRGRRRR